MTSANTNHEKIFGVVENDINNTKVIEEDIIEKPISFVEDLIRCGNFQGLTVVLTNQAINLFPTRKLAEDFYDEISQEYS
jgi:hypothetical protein